MRVATFSVLLVIHISLRQPCVKSWAARLIRRRHSTTLLTRLASKSATKLEEEDEDESFDWLETVSDAEALLACRAYLQRRKLLGEWTEGQARKQQRQLGFEQARQSDAAGFFWENPDELVYYDRTKRPQFLRNEGEEVDVVEEDGELLEEVTFDEEELDAALDTFEDTLQSSPMDSWRLSGIEESESDDTPWFPNDDLDEEDDALTNMESSVFAFDDETAYFSHQKRSNSAKRKFQNATWKEYWYERRWGSHTVPSARERRQKQLDKKLVQTEGMREFLGRPELSQLDEEMIEKAIVTYRESNVKRSVSVRRVFEERKTAPTEGNETIPRDMLYRPDPQQLERERHRRGEIAVERYRRRLENQTRQRPPYPTTNRAPTIPLEDYYRNIPEGYEPTPLIAMKRLIAVLDEIRPEQKQELLKNNSSSSLLNYILGDLDIVARPSRLAGRKSLLRRMLNDLFGMRGKCVPTQGGRLEFVTESTIADLVQCIQQTAAEAVSTHQTSNSTTTIPQPEESGDGT